MFVVRFVILGFLAFFSYSMGTERGGLNAFGTFVVFSGIVFIPAFYMLPTIEAWIRKSNNLPAIAAVNFFLGWSLLGWVAALVWAFKNPSPVTVAETPSGSEANVTAATDKKPSKDCPFCGEEILVVAIRCKHCGSDLADTAGGAV
jgi:predicted RNA-binding Zn-ribbon protein involved in translation (DUF1610 family)